MGNIIAERVKDAQLTKAQKMIAEYFIHNQSRIGSLSAMDVAKEIGVSDAAIIRFSRAIGFEGYADLKDQLYDSLVESAYGRMSLSERLTQNAEKYGGGAIQYQQLLQQNIDAVFRDNRPEDFVRAAEWITEARAKYVVGLRGCRGLAIKFGRLLSFMLPGVHTLTDGECSSIHDLQDIAEGDILVMFVFSRFYKIDLSYVKLARARGAKICLIVNEITGPLTPYADILLMVASANMSFYHSTIGADITAEYLLNLVSERAEFKERIDEQDAITRDQLL
ncbi:MAG: MurR/RpiR family transcriptional regulator [Oscillospiraceae bacterium]|nr:MurR/RpiR family transcriptional regulator [Oscillospiraceae bacterium]